MKISKELNITGVIIKPSDIRELAKKVYEEYESDNESDRKRINFILKGNDETQYESEDIEIFSDRGILDTRRIIGIEMTYFNYSNNKRISIKLDHTVRDYGWGNSISVSGSNELWVNGIIKNFEGIISNWEKQVILPHKYGWFLAIIFMIIFVGGIGLLCLNFLSKLEWSIAFGFSFGISFWLASYLVDELKKLYPIVELRTGPEHTQVEAKKRRKVYAIISIGVIPLIISLVVELIKIII
ncbi:MAG: hypothetical protein PWR26_1283 [Methanosarcinales archaeon]|nr:MAG: hypothetical protein XD46_0738 [Euryarchaeota archaeon 55_53]KUK30602.1 MAG: hypothetical protein XD62_0304 [Methanosarcinales archeaon 56_1174]MDI3488566.1 hypothetical protein [Methanosarcinales archaeon]MDN5295425.1 hypothetical protein [Methanosarcinales archaeon]